MTSTQVTELGAAVWNSVQGAKQAMQDGLPNFSDFMAKESGNAGVMATQTDSRGEIQTDAREVYEKEDKKAAQSIAKETKAGALEKESKALSEDTVKKLDACEKEVTKTLADALGVSEEEIKDAMELLGLTLADLTSQGNMAQLIAQVTQVQPVDILTDADLFAQMEELTLQVTDALSQVADELGVEPQELIEMVKEGYEANKMQPQPVEEPVTQITEALVQESGEEETSVKVETDAKTDALPKEFADETGNKLQQNLSDQPENEGQQLGENGSAGQRRTADDSNVSNIPNPQNAPVMQEFSAEAISAEQLYEEAKMPSTQEIIDQIAEYVKVHRSEQMTEMEIALNPASLGNIHLQVASKAGVVSAQLIAQDQAVAAALESQLLSLKESLQMQGLKVDAIEVTVASHQFEQNLDQQGKQQEEEAARTAAKRGQRRILDLNQMDEADGMVESELSDAEKLQMEMMRMGGNRMNYQI